MAIVLLAAPSQISDVQLGIAQQRLEAYLRGIRSVSVAYEEHGYFLVGRRETPFGNPRQIELLYHYPSIRLKSSGTVKDINGVELLSEVTTYIHRGQSTTVDHTLTTVIKYSSLTGRPFEWLPVDAIGLRVMHTTNTPLSDFLNCSDVVSTEGTTAVNGVNAEVFVIGPGIPDRIRPSLWGPESTVTAWLAPDFEYAPVRIEVKAHFRESVASFVYTAESFVATEDLAGGATIFFPRQVALQMGDTSIMRSKVLELMLNPRVTPGEFIPRISEEFSVSIDGQPPRFPSVRRNGARVAGSSARERLADQLLIEPPRAGERFRWDIALSIAGVLLSICVLIFVIRQCRTS